MSLDNPFPGMNPWLEDHWQSVHSRFLTYLGDQISDSLPEGLAALTEERVVVENLRDGSGKRAMVPDIAVNQPWDNVPPAGGKDAAAGGLALAEPLVVLLDDPIERSLHIVDGSGDLITAVELLSPVNKDRGDGQAAYLRKQRTYQEGGVNLVEIDLLRCGSRVFRAPAHHFGDRSDYPYGVSVWRALQPGQAFSYPIPLRKRLPVIPIPLRPGDAEVAVDLQPVVDQVYRNGRYTYLIRYEKGPEPRLSEDDAAWAKVLTGC
jgi:hypothetical protein